MSSLEEELACLKQKIAQAEVGGNVWNKLMDYLKELQKKENLLLEQSNLLQEKELKQLGSSAGNHCFVIV